MSDVVVGVRLQADGSGFVGQLKLSRAELDALSASAKNTSAAFDAGRAASQNYATMAARLHAALDPMYTVQQRFNQELNEAEALFKAGAISSRVYADAVRLANDNLRAGAAAVQASTGAAQQHTQALGAQRAGYQQLGFQMQDVFASYASGTRLSVIAAQQAGQFASAISLIGQASGESTTRFGRFANFMGGPWGIAIGVGVTALGALLAALDSSKEKTKDAEDAFVSLADKLDRTKNSYEAVIKATREYNDEQARSRQLTLDAAAAVAVQTAENIRNAKSKLLGLQEQLREEQKLPALYGYTRDDGTVVASKENYRATQLRGQIAATQKELRELEQGAVNSVNVIATEMAKLQTDPRYAIEQGFKKLREEAAAARMPVETLTKRLAELNRQERAALEALKDNRSSAAKSIGGTLAAFGSPLAGARLTGRYNEQRPGHRHGGIDLAAPAGTPIYAPQAGVVDFTGRAGAYGNLLKLGHGAGTETRYGHLSRFAVEKGQAVKKGDVLGYVGSTGRSTGPHLHYEVLINGKAVDPTKASFLIDEVKIAAAAQKSEERLQEFGDKAANSIAQINAEFDEQPRLIDRANAATATLNELIKGLNSEQPLGFEQLIADAEQAKIVIKESLNRPFEEFMAAQRESAEIDKLLLAGRYDEAEALKVVLRLQEQQGPLSEAQLKAVLATVEGARRLSMVMRDQRALIQANLDAIDDMRGALEQTVAGMLRGKLSAGAILSSIGNSYIQITSKRIVESMFGDTLRQLEEQATGQDKVRKASDGIAGALDDGSKAVKGFADVVRAVTGAIAPRPGVNLAPGEGTAGLSSSVFGAITNAVSGGGANNADPRARREIVVVGSKPEAASSKDAGGAFIVDLVREISRAVGIELPAKLTDSLKGILGKLETSLAESFKGALLGSAASSLVLGKSGSNTGAMLGGAFGESVFKKAAPKLFSSLGDFGGPIGSIVGGLLGGLVGGLFKKTKSGGASIGLDAKGNAGVTGTAGNSDELKKQASGWGGTLVNQLDRIAETLGADLGAFNVAIGKRDSGWIKVSASGNAAATTGKKVTSDIIYNGKDEGEALMAALGNAISDGAIKGVSAAVQKALKSSSDVEKALKEALKVQDVEIAIGGIGAELAKQFKDFERQAAERVRIAREYGFDLTKLEERNAQDRLKLTQSLMAEQVGSLQDLIEQMTGGSLFEGSAIDQRQVILDKIAAAKTAADAGDEGAADKLAALLEQLNAVSREAYGTTGNFASDRQTILDTARDTIARANQRIADAQRASDPALAATNAALNENNDQNASIIALLESIQNGMVARSYATGQIDYSQLANLARTSIY